MPRLNRRVVLRNVWGLFHTCRIICLLFSQFILLFVGADLHRARVYRFHYGAKPAQSQTRRSANERRTAAACYGFHRPVLHIHQKASLIVTFCADDWIRLSLTTVFFPEQMWLQGSCRQIGGGQKGNRNFRNLSTEGQRADLWCQTRMEECSSLCGTHPVVQTTGAYLLSLHVLCAFMALHFFSTNVFEKRFQAVLALLIVFAKLCVTEHILAYLLKNNLTKTKLSRLFVVQIRFIMIIKT